MSYNTTHDSDTYIDLLIVNGGKFRWNNDDCGRYLGQ